MTLNHPMISFHGKRVWITGANRGIGAAVCDLFWALGAEVVAFDRAFDDTRHPYKTRELDISNPDAVATVVNDELIQSGRLDVLINVAGILHMDPVEKINLQEWEASFATNVSGVLYMLQQTMPWFKAQKRGAIVTISSNANHAPRMGMGTYGASKAALTNLMKTAGLELAPFGVRCNIVSPGSTDTRMQRQLWKDDSGERQTIAGFPEQYKLGIPLGKIAQPVDIAYCAAFLASDWANHVILQDLVVDGGATLGA